MFVDARPTNHRVVLTLRRTLTSTRWLRRLVLGYLLAVARLTGLNARRLGDHYQVALPLLGLSCAAATGSAPEYVLRYAAAWPGMRMGKNTLGDRPDALRPNGGTGGMPAGHTTSAVFGVSALVKGCLSGNPIAPPAAVVAGVFTGASRISSGAQIIWQVLAGVLSALLCERALRTDSAPRGAIRRGLAAAALGAGKAMRPAAGGQGSVRG